MSKGRGQISVRGVVYDQLRELAQQKGTSISALVEAALVGAMDVPLIPVEDIDRHVHEEPPRLEDPPGPFLCASCGNDRQGVPYRLPWGRNDAMVDVCDACVNDHPRSGRYGFSEAGKPTGGSGLAAGSRSGKPGSR